MTSATAPVLASSNAVVVGGARGIGRACALRLAELGARVAVVDIDLEAAAEFGEHIAAGTVEAELQALSGDGLEIRADCADPAQVDAAFATVVERWGGVDVLVVTAGGAVTPFARSRASVTPDDDLQRLVDVNMRTVVNCCRAAVAAMQGRGGGAIVTTATAGALSVQPTGHLAAYAMTKAAVIQYSRYLAAEVGPSGIRVNVVAPGLITTARIVAQSADTGLVNDSAADAVPLRRLGEPDDIADAVQFLVTPASSYVTGHVLVVDGGGVLC